MSHLEFPRRYLNSGRNDVQYEDFYWAQVGSKDALKVVTAGLDIDFVRKIMLLLSQITVDVSLRLQI